MLGEADIHLGDPGEAGDADVVVAEGDLHGDIALTEDADADLVVAGDGEAVLAGAFAVAFDAEAEGGEELGDGRAEIAGGECELDHATCPRPRGRLRRCR